MKKATLSKIFRIISYLQVALVNSVAVTTATWVTRLSVDANSALLSDSAATRDAAWGPSGPHVPEWAALFIN